MKIIRIFQLRKRSSHNVSMLLQSSLQSNRRRSVFVGRQFETFDSLDNHPECAFRCQHRRFILLVLSMLR